MPEEKLEDAIRDLEKALGYLSKGKEDTFYYAGIAKRFEICFEYAWKYLKTILVEEGIEVYSPKDVVKQAGRVGLIENVEEWLGYLKDRNLAVHDYLGIADEDYLKTVQHFFHAVTKMYGSSKE